MLALRFVMKGLLYRSPNVLVDRVWWHVAVRARESGRPEVSYKFHDGVRGWRCVHQWPGRLPKALGEFFHPYRRSIAVALAGGARPLEKRNTPWAEHRRGRAMLARAA